MVLNNFQEKLQWSENYISEIKRILGELPTKFFINFTIAPLPDDIKNAIDMFADLDGHNKLQMRVRTPKYQYRDDFTIQFWKASGTETELEKFQRESVDYYFLAWTDDTKNIFKWILIDMHKVKSMGLLDRTWPFKTNGDSGQLFYIISADELRKNGCLVAYENIIFPKVRQTVFSILGKFI